MSIKFSDRVFGANVSSQIIKKFDELAGGGLKQTPQDLQNPVKPAFKTYLGDRTTFARMWTANLVSGSKRVEVTYHVVNDNRDESYAEPNESIGETVFKELTQNTYLKPKAGITGISSKTEGSLGAIKTTNVDFVVHNKHDFETIFLPFFLKPGSTVVVDYGWSDKSFKPYDVSKAITNTDLELSKFKDDIYGRADKKPNGYINDNLGVVDTIIGKVTDYNASVNAQGSFECSVTLTSENTSLLDTEITDDNNLKFVFSNKIEEVLIKTLTSAGSQDEAIGNAELRAYSKLSSKDKQQVRENFYNDIQITGAATGQIPTSALKSGLFYQDVTDMAGAKFNNKDVLYINYGLFEDLFLNGLIAENDIKENNVHSVNYNTKDTFVRYESNLRNRQKETFGTNEALSLFLYPDTWQDTYNGKTPIEEYRSHQQLIVDGNRYENEYRVPIIPFRELFISVSLISKKFAQKQNVNDALDSIIEALNQDSYGVFKLKMISLNNSNSSISLQDVNLIPELSRPKDLLSFDTTSETSIVSGLDYKFGMPKGGLSSMIAIGQKGDFDLFDDTTTDNLNFLRILGPDSDLFGDDVFFKALPLVKSDDEKAEEKSPYDFSQDKVNSIITNLDVVNTKIDFAESWTDIVTTLQSKANDDNTDTDTQPSTTTGVDFDFEYEDEKDILPANSIRDYHGKLAQVNTILDNQITSVSPILPIELTLTIYGNTYLQVGDIFNINFLPKYYANNIMFQITNIEQKLGSTWETTYSTVMRLRPDRKGNIVKPKLKKPKLSKIFTKKLITKKDKTNKHLEDAVGHSESVALSKELSMLAYRIELRYDRRVLKLQDIRNQTIRKSAKKRFQGDARLMKMEFNKPKSIFDLALIYSYQKTIIEYIIEGSLRGKDLMFHIKKDLTEYNGGTKLDGEKLTINQSDIFITALVEEKGTFKKFDDAYKDYLDELNVYEAVNNTHTINDTQKSNLAKKMAKSPKLKMFYERYLSANWQVNSTSTKTSFGLVEAFASGPEVDKGDLDDRYGFIMSSICFVHARKKYKGVRYGYLVDISKYKGVTENIPSIIIPEWFFKNAGGGINDFCLRLDENYKETAREFDTILTGYSEASVQLQTEIREQSMYEF